jgi:hypothetical protein
MSFVPFMLFLVRLSGKPVEGGLRDSAPMRSDDGRRP